MRFLRANCQTKIKRVERDEGHGVIRGYVVALEGPLKDGRGVFRPSDIDALHQLAKAAPEGVKSRFGHPTLSDDGVGKHLGRVRDTYLETISRKGERVEALRGDLHFAESAHDTPAGDLATYVMDRADEDPDAISSSVVITVDETEQADEKGKPLRDDDGNRLPPFWTPTELHASDVVGEGAAVDGILSLDALPDRHYAAACEMLDQLLGKFDDDEAFGRLLAFADKYMHHRTAGQWQSRAAQLPEQTEGYAALTKRLTKMIRAQSRN